MTTREIYFKFYVSTYMPVGMIGYTYHDEYDTIQIGRNHWLKFDDHEKNILEMKKIEKTDGFMFWNNSTIGEKFFKENWNIISDGLSNIVLNQK